MAGDTPQNSRDPNFDVALSTRASEVTLTSVNNFVSRLDVNLSTRASEVTVATLATQATAALIKTNTDNLDTTLTIQSRLNRWGRNVDPTWVHGAAVTAPAALTNLVSQTVTAGKTGYFYGFLITAQEANDFIITWTSSAAVKTIRITYGGKGTVESVDVVSMNEGLGADATTTITIANESVGTAGLIYQARLLYTEV
jgi:hypothetical protein